MLLSIDPGVNNCGLAVVDTTEYFNVVHTSCVKNARKFSDEEKALEKEFNTRVVKVSHILQSVNDLLDVYPKIDFVAIETPFYNALTPLAFGSLMEVISAIKYNILVPKGLRFRMLEPMLIKRMFVNTKLIKGMTKKEVIKQYLNVKLEAGTVVYTGDVDLLSEHEIDAIAIAFVSHMFTLEESRHDANVPT